MVWFMNSLEFIIRSKFSKAACFPSPAEKTQAVLNFIKEQIQLWIPFPIFLFNLHCTRKVSLRLKKTKKQKLFSKGVLAKEVIYPHFILATAQTIKAYIVGKLDIWKSMDGNLVKCQFKENTGQWRQWLDGIMKCLITKGFITWKIKKGCNIKLPHKEIISCDALPEPMRTRSTAQILLLKNVTYSLISSTQEIQQVPNLIPGGVLHCF